MTYSQARPIFFGVAAALMIVGCGNDAPDPAGQTPASAAPAEATIAQAADLTAYQQMARDILKELIEIDTTDSSGSNTEAANAMAARLIAAGFPEEDVQVLEPVPGKGNLVARYRGRGIDRTRCGCWRTSMSLRPTRLIGPCHHSNSSSRRIFLRPWHDR